MNMGLKERFLRVYGNLPLSLREDVVLTLGEKDIPMTWNAVYFEIKSDSEVSQELLEKLSALGFI